MNDVFDFRTASPMLVTESEPFDSENFIYELKLDGVRALAYLDENGTDIRNKRNKMVSSIYPELNELHKFVNKKCIIDGELIVLTNGKPDFFEIQRRSLMNDSFRIALAAKKNPVRFVAYDIIYTDDSEIISTKLIERKKILEDTIRENDKLSVSRFIYTKGIEFFNLVSAQDLEGVVGKKTDSLYYYGKRSKDWIKFKNMLDSDFVICGYVPDEETSGIKSVALGAYYGDKLLNQGHVSLGIPKDEQKIILKYAASHTSLSPYYDNYHDNETIYMIPELVCTVKYMMKTQTGGLRQPVYKGLRTDKSPEECLYTT